MCSNLKQIYKEGQKDEEVHVNEIGKNCEPSYKIILHGCICIRNLVKCALNVQLPF